MKFSCLPAAALLWQSALLVNIGTEAAPEHLRFERPITLPSSMPGNVACVPLDPTVLAHTASAAHDDLRLFRGSPGVPETETPYVLTESGPEPVADTEAHVEHARVERGEHGLPSLSFDLRMPDRPFSEVRLRLRARDFVGTATVTGIGRRDSRSALGSFSVFDLSSQHLGASTVLPMAETRMPEVHLQLTLRTPQGRPFAPVFAGLVEGATVPASREEQTLFVPVAQTTAVIQSGASAIAELYVPAHVPVERVAVELPAHFELNAAGEVDLFARPQGLPSADTEAINAGTVEQVRLPSGDPRVNPIDVRRLHLDATLGATLGSRADVRVVVRGEGGRVMPIRSVALEMRARNLCFFANSGTVYTLRYGDPALPPPVYDTTALLSPGLTAAAQLGPESRNPGFKVRQDTRPYLRRHPEVPWVLFLLFAGTSGGVLLHRVQREGI